MQFKREASYFIQHIYIPGVLLQMLMLALFTIPRGSADRPMYAATILLSLFVHQGEMLSNLPKSPKYIYLATYAMGITVFSTVCTLYSAIMYFVSEVEPEWAKKVVINTPKFKMGLLTLLDLISFIVFLLAAVFLNALQFVSVLA